MIRQSSPETTIGGSNHNHSMHDVWSENVAAASFERGSLQPSTTDGREQFDALVTGRSAVPMSARAAPTEARATDPFRLAGVRPDFVRTTMQFFDISRV